MIPSPVNTNSGHKFTQQYEHDRLLVFLTSSVRTSILISIKYSVPAIPRAHLTFLDFVSRDGIHLFDGNFVLFAPEEQNRKERMTRTMTH